jgi:hypothetical protein
MECGKHCYNTAQSQLKEDMENLQQITIKEGRNEETMTQEEIFQTQLSLRAK